MDSLANPAGLEKALFPPQLGREGRVLLRLEPHPTEGRRAQLWAEGSWAQYTPLSRPIPHSTSLLSQPTSHIPHPASAGEAEALLGLPHQLLPCPALPWRDGGREERGGLIQPHLLNPHSSTQQFR